MLTKTVEDELAAGKRFGYRPEFDGLRGVAILGVVALHYFPNWFRAAVIGVDLFFVLSGFLITRLILEERQRFGSVSLRNFYAKRFGRLVPGILMLVVLVLPATSFLQDQRRELLWGSLAAVTFSTNWFRVFGVDVGGLGHLWSIAIEQQFYLLWPLMMISVRLRLRRVQVLAAAIAIAAGTNIVLRRLSGEEYRDLFDGLDARGGMMLLAGCWLATVMPLRSMTRAMRQWLVVALVLLLGLRLWLSVLPDPRQYARFWCYGGIQITAPTMVLVLLAVKEVNMLKRWLVLRPLRWLGRLAYSIFLWHQPVEMLLDLDGRIHQLWVRNLVYFALSLVLAVLGNRFIEQPARAWIIRRFGDPARRPAATTPAVAPGP